jgi:hypothetical protein
MYADRAHDVVSDDPLKPRQSIPMMRMLPDKRGHENIGVQ